MIAPHYLSPASVGALRCRASELWRREPRFADPSSRTDLLLRLHGLRLDLEDLDRRIRDERVGPEDERTLFLCAARLEELADLWADADADPSPASTRDTDQPDPRREPQCA